MKGLKKIIVMAILSVMMALCSVGAFTAFAEESVSTTRQVNICADQVETTVGEKERLSFYAEGYANVAGFHFIIVLPSNVTFSSFEIAEGFKSSNYQYSINANEISIICNSDNQTYASTTDLFYIDVIAREEGYGDAWYRNYTITDFDANDIYCLAYSVGITVLGEGQESIVRGDVDGDDCVGVQDLMLMQRYILGSLGDELNFSTTAGDIDGDYDIDLIDCQQVQRYLVGKISFDELQNLSNGNGNPDIPVVPDDPSAYQMTYDVMYGAEMLKQALTIDVRDWKTEFVFNGERMFGTTIALNLIDESYSEGVAVFIPYNSAVIYKFVMGEKTMVKLDLIDDLDVMVEEYPANFNKELAGEYRVTNNLEELGYITVQENGVFTGFANFRVNGTYFSLNINGIISDEDGTTFANLFGIIGKEIRIDAKNKAIYPLENGEVVGNNVHFDIYYILENGNSIHAEAYYAMKEGQDVNEVAKMLAHQNLMEGYVMNNYSVNYLQDGRYSIDVWVSERGGSSGDVTQGKKIQVYMHMADDKHYMLQPYGEITVPSLEFFKEMLKNLTVVPEETQMEFKGLYIDRELKVAYTEEMGIDISELYVVCTYVKGSNLLDELGGTYSLKTYDDNGNQTTLTGSLTIDEDKKTFGLTMGDAKYNGEAVAIGKSYDEDGNLYFAQLTLITANNVQINATLNFTDKGAYCVINGVDDYSGYTAKEELKAVAGVYNTYITYGGMDMGKCDITLQDNGVFTLQMFFMKQIGSYELMVSTDGKTTIIMTVDGDPQDATIDFVNKTVYISVQMGGGSSDVNGGVGGGNVSESTKEYVATIYMVDYSEKTRIYLSEDSFGALKEELYEMFGDLERVTIYVDEQLQVELTIDNFETACKTFYVVINENYVENNQNGYEGGSGEVTDKVITIK